MVTLVIQKFVHGSEDSIDVDVFFVVESLSSVQQENKVLCDKLSHDHGVNGNIITIGKVGDSRVVTGVYKGTIDEVNNSLFCTYGLHKQEFPIPIDDVMERDAHHKILRVIRGLLSHCSRTEHRHLIKAALRSESIFDKINTLSKIQLSEITDFGDTKAPLMEVRKFFAFQIIQALGLMRYPTQEIYTKKDAASFFPSATPILYRVPYVNVCHVIDDLQDRFLQAVYQSINQRNVTLSDTGHELYTHFGTLSVKTEKYV